MKLMMVSHNLSIKKESVAQLCSALCDPMDCSLPGYSVHRSFQARIQEWVAISSSRGSSQPMDRTYSSCVSCVGRQILYQLSYHRSPIKNLLDHKKILRDNFIQSFHLMTKENWAPEHGQCHVGILNSSFPDDALYPTPQTPCPGWVLGRRQI